MPQVIFQKFIYREDLKNNPSVLYLFGDNDLREGIGGQARQMRGEPNSKGIRVKRFPKRERDAYYSDKEYKNNIMKINQDLLYVESVLQRGEIVIIPTDGIGTGLARLKEFAPKTLEYLQKRLKEITEEYN